MMKWFGKNRLDDERILHLKNKIFREAFILIMVICNFSLLLKLLVFRSDLESVITELVIVTAASLYYSIRTVTLGIYSEQIEAHDSRSKVPYSRKNILSGLGTGMAISLFFGIRSAILYGDGQFSTQAWYFFIVFAVSLMIYLPFFIGILAVTHSLANKASKKVSDDDLLDS
ncbi:hypothetical protein DFP94_103363 [Fontibacillus phaseoli]|uniref:Uncharacterized protein n=1 Tax=Fontibacillus phaseoli TaxID=1416533 RepID=A0A369BGU5_9BACL|nr:DUF6773 family protein [Fontibacillus phaseoli]RCX20631.1 hypothetical protein DFP94_103363 [Fontibacillus phaseoli]